MQLDEFVMRSGMLLGEMTKTSDKIVAKLKPEEVRGLVATLDAILDITGDADVNAIFEKGNDFYTYMNKVPFLKDEFLGGGTALLKLTAEGTESLDSDEMKGKIAKMQKVLTKCRNRINRSLEAAG